MTVWSPGPSSNLSHLASDCHNDTSRSRTCRGKNHNIYDLDSGISLSDTANCAAYIVDSLSKGPQKHVENIIIQRGQLLCLSLCTSRWHRTKSRSFFQSFDMLFKNMPSQFLVKCEERGKGVSEAPSVIQSQKNAQVQPGL